MPQPATVRKGLGWNCVRTGSEGLSGGNWMVVRVSLVRRGCRCGRVLDASLPLTNSRPLGGVGLSGRSGLVPGARASRQACYLVDSASSHMLVSKIKPCMSKYKQLVL
jgi:hypothetical protein